METKLLENSAWTRKGNGNPRLPQTPQSSLICHKDFLGTFSEPDSTPGDGSSSPDSGAAGREQEAHRQRHIYRQHGSQEGTHRMLGVCLPGRSHSKGRHGRVKFVLEKHWEPMRGGCK